VKAASFAASAKPMLSSVRELSGRNFLGNCVPKNPSEWRKNAPVFVVGCHRSGTNLLYDTLMSAGGFAIYRGYLPIYKMLIPRFGGLDKDRSRKKIIANWLRSKGFRRSGLEASALAAKLENSRNGGDFIRIVMDGIAENQSCSRWAVYDPDDVLYLPQIKRDIPAALFVHIIRDGRDIALSLRKMGGFTPFFWNRKPAGLVETALYWEWMVRKGRHYGSAIPGDYIEVRYEDLVAEPRRTLAALGDFLQHDLDYDRIQKSSLGTLRNSNSSFRQEEQAQPGPLNRWRQSLSKEEIASIEAIVGNCLAESGYALTTSDEERKTGLRDASLRSLYASFLDTKLWFKIKTPMGRFTNTSALELTETVGQTESLA
jgi:hypothetical protein